MALLCLGMRCAAQVATKRLLAAAPKRNASKYAKLFGYGGERTEQKVNIFSLIGWGALSFVSMYLVMQDRKTHFKVFNENYVEGKEYLEVPTMLAHGNFHYQPPVDRFLGVSLPSQVDRAEEHMTKRW